MDTSFTPWHRGGSGSPLVCVHGLSDTWRSWALALPALERRHDVLAVTLAGQAGGPPLAGAVTNEVLADGVQRAMDEAGLETAHIVEGRRRATVYTTTNYEHIPSELLAHQIRGVAASDGLLDLVGYANREGWELDPEQITCPVRVVWGTEDNCCPGPVRPPATGTSG